MTNLWPIIQRIRIGWLSTARSFLTRGIIYKGYLVLRDGRTNLLVIFHLKGILISTRLISSYSGLIFL